MKPSIEYFFEKLENHGLRLLDLLKTLEVEDEEESFRMPTDICRCLAFGLRDSRKLITFLSKRTQQSLAILHPHKRSEQCSA